MKKGWPLLAPFSLLYSGAVTLRNTLYDQGIIKSTQTGVAVLSVGNLTAGGSGKSPLTQAFAMQLRDRVPDLPLAVVSRGYGRRTKGPQVVADGKNVLLTPDLGGDEPVMLAHTLETVPVIVAEKRVEGIALAQEQFGARMVVLDDAFQHRRVARDLDVVLIDASEPDWIWRPLPAGRLRELPGALSRAHLVVITGHAEPKRRERLAQFVRQQSEAIVVEGVAELTQVRSHETGERRPIEELQGKRVAAACAIARPERYFNALESAGAELVLQRAWRDHSWTTRNQREQLMMDAVAAGAEMVVITAKDAVKWPGGEEGLPVWVPELQWNWGSGTRELEQQLDWFVETARHRSILHP